MKTKYIPKAKRNRTMPHEPGLGFNIKELEFLDRLGPRKFKNGLLRVKFVFTSRSRIAGEADVIDFLEQYDLVHNEDFVFPAWNYTGPAHDYSSIALNGRQLYVTFTSIEASISLKMMCA